MGLGLQSLSFSDWLGRLDPPRQQEFVNEFYAHVGTSPSSEWVVDERRFERVGSYTSFGVFRLCLEYMVRGDPESKLNETWDVEHEALSQFRNVFRPQSAQIQGVSHLLDVGDTDALFVPIEFGDPWEWDERWIASKPIARVALEGFARARGFDLREPFENEGEDHQSWNAVATAHNVARILHSFFVRTENGCVEFS